MDPEDQIRVTCTDCDLDWTGPRRAWDAWFEDCHIRAHRKGRDGIPATSRTRIEVLAA